MRSKPRIRTHRPNRRLARVAYWAALTPLFLAGCGSPDGSGRGEEGTADARNQHDDLPSLGDTIPPELADLPRPDSRGDHIVYRFIAGFTEMTRLLDTVTDSTSATAVSARIQAVASDLRALIPQGDALPEDERAATNAKYSERLQLETQRFALSLQRAASQPGAGPILTEAIHELNEPIERDPSVP